MTPTSTAQPATTAARAHKHRAKRRTAWQLVVLLAVLALLAWFASSGDKPGGAGWRTWLWGVPALAVELNGRHYRVPAARAPALQSTSQHYLDEAERFALAAAEARIDRGLDAVFGAAEARLQDYADWHYSLRGEYTRLSLSLMQQLGWGDGAEQESLRRLFGDDAPATWLRTLQQDADAELMQGLHHMRQAWVEALVAMLDGDAGARLDDRVEPAAISLSGIATRMGGNDPVFLARVGVSGVAGVGAATSTLRAGLVLRRGAQMAARAGTQAAGRGAARGGSLLGCAATGPAAAWCAVLVGGATWIATDALLLGADEWMHREAFIAGWRETLHDTRAEVRRTLVARPHALLAQWRLGAADEIERTFRPLDLIQGEKRDKEE